MQDFFFELMRDSQRARAPHLAERERWIRSLAVAGREEVLFELEMLLRGLDRFFNLRNLFGEEAPPPERDFRDELKAARDALHRATHLSRRLILQRQEQALLFRSFVEGTLADDRARARMGAEVREQRTPEESLFLLRTCLVSHQGIVDHLLRLDFAPQTLFLDVGRALQHELFVSRYFCPPAALEFRVEYDRVGSVKLLETLRVLSDEKRRRAFSLGLLASFRALRSLRYVPAPPVPQGRRVLLTLALVRTELSALVGYLETDLPRLCAAPEGVRTAAAAGRAAAAPLRSALTEVAPLLRTQLTDRAQLDRMRDVFVEAVKDCVGAIARSLDEGLDRRALFEDDASRVETSERLRSDLWCFREMCRITAEGLESPQAGAASIEPIRRFATDFRDVGYQLLRHSDRELFDRFLDLLDGWSGRQGDASAVRLRRLRDDCRRFAEILDKALDAVARRVELLNVPMDERAYGRLLARHLGRG
ncbi:MAG: hypothetical protein NVS2B9_05400 [Myxococcales bacterium]